jgi:hypothetical protein
MPQYDKNVVAQYTESLRDIYKKFQDPNISQAEIDKGHKVVEDYYRYLKDCGINYGSIGEKVVNKEHGFGKVAQFNLESAARLQGFDERSINQIKQLFPVQLAIRDASLRIDENSGIINARAISDYHIEELRIRGLPGTAWGGSLFEFFGGTGSWQYLAGVNDAPAINVGNIVESIIANHEVNGIKARDSFMVLVGAFNLDIIEAFRAGAIDEGEALGRSSFVYSLFSSLVKNIINGVSNLKDNATSLLSGFHNQKQILISNIQESWERLSSELQSKFDAKAKREHDEIQNLCNLKLQEVSENYYQMHSQHILEAQLGALNACMNKINATQELVDNCQIGLQFSELPVCPPMIKEFTVSHLNQGACSNIASTCQDIMEYYKQSLQIVMQSDLQKDEESTKAIQKNCLDELNLLKGRLDEAFKLEYQNILDTLTANYKLQESMLVGQFLDNYAVISIE